MLLAVVVVAAALAAAARSAAQDPERPGSEALQELVRDMALGKRLADQLKPEILEEARTLINSLPDLSTEQKAAATGFLTDAIDRLAAAVQVRERAGAFQDAVVQAPDEEAQIREELEEGPETSLRDRILPDEPIENLESRLAELESVYRTALQEKALLDAEPRRRAERRAEIARLRIDLQDRIEKAEAEIAGAADLSVPQPVRLSSRALALANLTFFQAEEQLYQDESRAFEATATGLRLRQDLAARRVARLDTQLRQYRDEVRRRREEQAALVAAEAESRKAAAAARLSPPALRLAQENVELAERRAEVVGQLSSAQRELVRLQSELRTVESEFRDLQARVESVERVGLSGSFALGVILRRAEASLPTPRSNKNDVEARLEAISQAQLEQIRLFDRRLDAAGENRRLAQLEASMPRDLPPAEQDEFMTAIRELVETNRDLVSRLVNDLDDVVGTMLAGNEAQVQLSEAARAFRGFIDERVLWIRSNEVLTAEAFFAEAGALVRTVFSSEFLGIFAPLGGDASRHRWLYLGFVLAMGLLVWKQRHFRKKLEAVGRRAAQAFTLSMRPSLEALGWTVLVTLPVPLALAFVAWRLDAVGAAGTLAENAVVALWRMAFFSGVLLFARQACRPFGLADAHFGMSRANTAVLRRHLQWATYVLIPLGFFTYLFEGEYGEGVSNRVLFLDVLVVGGIFLGCLFSSKSGLRWPEKKRGARAGAKARSVDRSRLARILVILLFGGIGVVSILGYNYTARVVWHAVFASLLMMVAYLPVRAFVLLWSRIYQRRLALEAARQAAGDKDGQGKDPRVAAESVDLAKLDQSESLERSVAQTGRFLNFAFAVVLVWGLFAAWDNIIPAVHVLDQKVLWYVDDGEGNGSTTSGSPSTPGLPLVGGSGGDGSAGADGGGATGPGAEGSGNAGGSVDGGASDGRRVVTPMNDAASVASRRHVSVADLVYAIVAGLIAIVAARNVPGFLDMAVLQNSRFTPGERYAFKTLLSYVIVLAGVIVVSQMLGLSWTKIQWLAAAVSVGIGFGLQEIFANFVSGLILLFEQPIRIGDVVTIGEVSGVVSKIRMRATSIRDWDNKELVIPNKDLATGQFVNWSLTDSVLRIVIPVGIAYESDVRAAQQTLLNIVQNHPRVLKDPAPTAYFDGFGDSTLNFLVRAYVGDLDDRVMVRHELNVAILERFREQGIEIAFPQRDLHIRSVPPEFVMRSEARGEAASAGAPPDSPGAGAAGGAA